ncbi:MAG: hypothetical protein SFV81_07790 [Pirellulaceae bacterium]|nr:hypothetical protein [Pirellulaceae bacterium]
MTLSLRTQHLGIICAMLLLAAGCGPGNPRREVSGKITFKGAPLDHGTIEFNPLGGGKEGVPTTKEGANITNGEYKILAETGLTPGKYQVIISSGDNIDPKDPEGMPGPSGNYVSKDRIPAAYNTASTQEVEVTDKGPNVFNWEIK